MLEVVTLKVQYGINLMNMIGVPFQADGCSLHLHLGYSSTIYRIPAILSEENAPGIVIAHGGMGTGLDLSVSTAFMSRNGGLTWTQVHLYYLESF